ncbi:sterol desaturase family protein [Octadecabacter ascidiaceicola]|uniref:Fatty acid hydroxylase superfamily protein n=1 Tax=Octadecabacter ascidiaceicola TaxID=1655543 RepID=A0A238JMA1_9RHOB|nr:sterol desaturase family protein [Octadecabacter ascidiaceicola]SMX31800.1 Fatty acid hydroxylase superfamily protein [Octadecabacter ascidiaceicola]
MRILWPLHAVHHSAEVMTPITAYRQHPLGLFVIVAIQTSIMGLVLGVIVGTLDPQATTAEIVGVNAFTAIAVIAMANFHHSHIWISFGPIVERIIISPAQHQIHHSTNPAHYNRNYGGTLAIWDWIFGTLYLTGDDETITLGLTEKGDAPLMTHRLDLILIDPVLRALRAGR